MQSLINSANQTFVLGLSFSASDSFSHSFLSAFPPFHPNLLSSETEEKVRNEDDDDDDETHTQKKSLLGPDVPDIMSASPFSFPLPHKFYPIYKPDSPAAPPDTSVVSFAIHCLSSTRLLATLSFSGKGNQQ